jgi:hypothetical protein
MMKQQEREERYHVDDIEILNEAQHENVSFGHVPAVVQCSSVD